MDKDRFEAAIEMVRRTGAKQVQIRYSDDEEPVVWFVVAVYDVDVWEVDAAENPLNAINRLLERLIDGSKCKHCNRPAGFEPNLLVRMPMDKMICWYQYDPELKTYRRGCE